MKSKSKYYNTILVSGAVAFLLIIVGIGIYNLPYAYVSLDVNPSIQYTINRYDKVLSVKGANDDGTKIIDEINLDKLKNKDINDAVALTIDRISKSDYLEENDNEILIATTSENSKKAEDLAKKLEDSANQSLKKNNRAATVTAEAIGFNRVAEAQKLGVTPGKLNLVEKLIESSTDPASVDKNLWLNKTVKEIMVQTNTNKQQNKTNNNNNGQNETKQSNETKESKETKNLK